MIVPETAVRPSKENENVHYGRGGAGNAVHANSKPMQKTVSQHGFDKQVPHDSFKDKVKEIFHKDK